VNGRAIRDGFFRIRMREREYGWEKKGRHIKRYIHNLLRQIPESTLVLCI
jgi:hypothetical protein